MDVSPKLSYFHVARNTAPDIMHDFLEGLIPLELKLVLEELSVGQRKFTLNELNMRILSFNYGFVEQCNKPSAILPGHLANPSGASGQSAAQMHCLAIYFPILIGDKVPEHCQFWKLFKLLLEIYKLASAPCISVNGTSYLKSKISEHHQLYLELFPENHLIPKHHHVVHYPRAIRMLGPLCQYSNIRHEAKHKPLKKWAHICMNYKNIALTLATKHQEAQAYRSLKKEDIENRATELYDQSVVEVSSFENEEAVCNLLDCTPQTELIVCGVVELYGYKYRPNMMLLSGWNEVPKFAMIQVIIRRGSTLHFLVQPWTTLEYEDHYQAYIVSDEPTLALELTDPLDMFDYRPVHTVESYCTTDNI